MKKLFCLAVLCFALFICGCGQETPPAESQVQESSVTVKQPVQWKDETVRKLVYDELNRDYSEDVYPYELENISCLYIIGDKKISFNGRPAGGIEPEKPYEIKFSGVLRTENGYERVDTVFTDTAEMCLDDLVHFTGLTDLFIHLVKPEDLSFLSSLPQLDTLGMGCCELDSLEGIEGCKNLKWLYLPYNNISDLSHLTGLPLQDLFMPHNNISDISPLAEMEIIPDELVLSYNSISDISPLSGAFFNYLNLRNNNISDISVLAECGGIPILSLTYNNISDVSPLKNLPKDSTIYIRGNPVENIHLLKDFGNVYHD